MRYFYWFSKSFWHCWSSNSCSEADGLRGIANNWLSSYLQNRTQFVTITGFVVMLWYLLWYASGFYTGTTTFSNLNKWYCKVDYFAGATNLLNFNNSIKKINKQIGHDLKYLSYWLNANKICLNVSKTEVVLFKSIRKQTEATLKLKLNGKRLYTTNSVKYLGIKIDENLNWHEQINNVAVKLNS